ncbi:MAG: hypothetical protein A2X96_02570 [Syntrophobacterales bacterium GWC2_56_13]|nr:MAG: hypothetical protein A2X96_02570 [Syntrophobacterales bacterium GWC2_56_13]
MFVRHAADKISLTNKARLRILPPKKSKFLSIIMPARGRLTGRFMGGRVSLLGIDGARGGREETDV